MRLPLRHPPLRQDARGLRCAYLEELARAALGLPLGPVADILLANAGRGRHGNALQWHLGLPARDGSSAPDWEERIEIKLVSVWSRSDGTVVCDKLKVCDVNVDPWRKLANVLWIFADRLTRVVVGYQFTVLRGEARTNLEGSWESDPHFSRPALFVEARESAGGIAPAYYLSASWLAGQGLTTAVAPLAFDPAMWTELRHDRHRLRMVMVNLDALDVACPHCQGTLSFERAHVLARGWAHAQHRGFQGLACTQAPVLVVDGARVPVSEICSRAEQGQALAGLMRYETLWRLADRVAEPDDHLH